MNMVTIVPTHDVDWISVKSMKGLRTFFGFLRRELLKSDLSSLNIPHWNNFKEWMELENKYDVRSAFYFLHKDAGGSTYDFTDVEDVVKDLDKGHWEIGLHGTFQSATNLQNIVREKNSLEKILGKNIQGIRMHYLRISEKSLKLQEETGFKYDSSLETPELFRIFHPVVKHVKLNLIEIPLTLHDGTLFVKRRMEVKEAYRYSCKIIDMASRADGIVTLNWHQHVFSPEFKPWLRTYMLILEHAKKIGAEILRPIDVVHRFQAQTIEFSSFIQQASGNR